MSDKINYDIHRTFILNKFILKDFGEILNLEQIINDFNKRISEIEGMGLYYFVLKKEDLEDYSETWINNKLPKNYKDFLGKMVMATPMFSIQYPDFLCYIEGYGIVHMDLLKIIPEERLINTAKNRFIRLEIKDIDKQYIERLKNLLNLYNKYEHFNF